ncbi:unnamed protein product [Angiostrongylus costaricensis]|uniref:Uncharacterized protein n=1 Tax=Angiostrongylus costaricensis TaxID=334426 RepID=A0A158PDD4_ANGCS|nr:unnamed protein product [Angiostrongylus costaricensis]
MASTGHGGPIVMFCDLGFTEAIASSKFYTVLVAAGPSQDENSSKNRQQFKRFRGEPIRFGKRVPREPISEHIVQVAMFNLNHAHLKQQKNREPTIQRYYATFLQQASRNSRKAGMDASGIMMSARTFLTIFCILLFTVLYTSSAPNRILMRFGKRATNTVPYAFVPLPDYYRVDLRRLTALFTTTLTETFGHKRKYCSVERQKTAHMVIVFHPQIEEVSEDRTEDRKASEQIEKKQLANVYYSAEELAPLSLSFNPSLMDGNNRTRLINNATIR